VTKYLFAAWTSFRTHTTYRAEIVGSVLTTLFTLAVQVFLWQSLYRTSPQSLGVSADAMITYFIISSTIGLVLRNADMTWQMAEDVKQGVIATFICRPVFYPIHTFFRALGTSVFSFAFMGIPLAAAGALLFHLQPPASPAAALLAVLVSLGAFVVYFLIWFITGTMSFWVSELHWSVPGFINALMWFFSGSVIPLWIFPDWLRGIALVLPARFAYDLPLSIYIGRISPAEGVTGLGMEAAWIGALCGAAFLFWRAGTRKLAIHGG
jgi:ABC-2 type transport system permease protein